MRSLTVADFLRSLIITSTNLYFFVNMGNLKFSRILCMLNRTTAYGVVTVSGFSISLIAINRLVRIYINYGDSGFISPRLKMHQNLLQKGHMQEYLAIEMSCA
jgi:hypothetical protein